MNEEILRRILVAKHMLAANSGQLTPNSDAVTVARMILVAHDAAELALAAIASHLNVILPQRETFLMSYPAAIEERTKQPLSGRDYLRQLNEVRIGFKHLGILPNVGTWYRVIERVWERTDEWCQAYLNVGLDAIDLESLLADADVRAFYSTAKDLHAEGRYREALEALGVSLRYVLQGFPGMFWPSVGRRNTEEGLMLAAFGVRPSDYLTLQDFLPEVTHDFKPDWRRRERGHEGNWTAANVRFCLATFLDVALKIQHAVPVPMALPFAALFDDTITPRGESANLYEYVRDQVTGQPLNVSTVKMTLQKGEVLRCYLSAHDLQRPFGLSGLGPGPPLETADRLSVWLKNQSEKIDILHVYRNDVEIGWLPREEEWVRKGFPHLFPSPDPATPPPTPPAPARGQGF